MNNSATAALSAAAVSPAVIAGGTKPFCIPRRINDGGLARLTELGVEIGGQRDFQYLDAKIPASWNFRDTTVSPWQKRLFDGNDNLVAQLFYKPCGGTPSINVFLTEDEAKAIS